MVSVVTGSQAQRLKGSKAQRRYAEIPLSFEPVSL
jgi:hypothetical protein